jgi:hypothetical protein
VWPTIDLDSSARMRESSGDSLSAIVLVLSRHRAASGGTDPMPTVPVCRSSLVRGGLLDFVAEVGRQRSTRHLDGSHVDDRRRALLEEANAATQDHRGDMQAELVDRTRSEYWRAMSAPPLTMTSAG